LDKPEQLFEIRWQSRGGNPDIAVEVTLRGKTWTEYCKRNTSLQGFLYQIRAPERPDRLIRIGTFEYEGELTRDEDINDQVADYFPQKESQRLKLSTWRVKVMTKNRRVIGRTIVKR
jgi:hypothetical protein